MPPKLTRGGRELVEQLVADVADAHAELEAARAELEELRSWNKRREPYDVERKAAGVQRELTDTAGALDRLTRRIREELEPMLQRREASAPSVEAQLAELARKVAHIETQLAAAAPPAAPHIRRVQ